MDGDDVVRLVFGLLLDPVGQGCAVTESGHGMGEDGSGFGCTGDTV